jgi:hypothetical protein
LPRRCRTFGLLILVLLCLTYGLGYRFFHQPRLDVGKIAPQTIWAPASASVEDTQTTQEKREAAQQGVFPAVRVDATANQQIQQQLKQWIDRGNQIRSTLGGFPFTSTAILSTGTQIYLRKTADAEWQSIQQMLGVTPTERSRLVVTLNTPLQTTQQRALRELQTYRQTVAASTFSQLLATVQQARQRYPLALSLLANSQIAAPQPIYDIGFLSITHPEWRLAQVEVQHILDRMLAQGIYPGLSDAQLQRAIDLHLQSSRIPSSTQPLASQILATVLTTNLIPDPEQTQWRAEQAAQAIASVMVHIQAGEVIVRAGEPITQEAFVLLDHFRLSQRGINGFQVLAFSGYVGLAIVGFKKIEQTLQPRFRPQDYLLVFLLVLTPSLIIAVSQSYTGLPALGLLLGSFYGVKVGTLVIAALSPLLAFGTEIRWDDLLPGAIAGLLGSLMASGKWHFFQREVPRTREDLATLGVLIGLTQGIVDLLIHMAIAVLWYTALGGAIVSAFIGVIWSILAIGLSPYLEWIFDLVTPIRLAELSNPNRPLLKRLAREAPGTFQHTQFVAILAETAAQALGCNVELVRAGTLHHDIGKLHDPLAFIENQMGGVNKHHEIDDPWLSAMIIKKHVSEGLVIARKNHLPSAIQAFIPEHQGTILIAYFHHQAQQRQVTGDRMGDRILQAADFRYDGPIPQSRETGIVMLADACEAALRSLDAATPADALAMVNKILKARWQEQQLVDSGLTRQDLNQIAHIFVQVWQQVHHKRIVYPKS